jgi:dTDP-4-dehydrorhamnose reductase
MKVAIIGAKGQLGNDLVRTKPEGIVALPFDLEDVDITERAQVLSLLGESRPFAVINAAAYVKVDDAEDESGEAFRVNALGVKHLAEACSRTGAVLLQVSTDYVFDGLRSGEPYTEDDAPNPVNAYGISKYAGELFVKNYLDRHYVVRTCSLYGAAGARGKGGNFVFTILDRARKGQPLRVVDDIFMSPTYARDAAVWIWDMLRGGYAYGTYHVANSGFCTWYDFARAILGLSGLSADIQPVAHTAYAMKARRPRWSPLASARGLVLRRWESALEAFLGEARGASPS